MAINRKCVSVSFFCSGVAEGKRMDAKRHKPDHPDYDARTLYVPSDFVKNETAAMQQWWELKSKNMDTVLFFKVKNAQTVVSQ